jgi:DNA-binding transcriptional LysR family regulator
MVEDDLAAGRLVRITVAEWGSDPYSVELILLHRAAVPPGPAGRWLIEALTARRPS